MNRAVKILVPIGSVVVLALILTFVARSNGPTNYGPPPDATFTASGELTQSFLPGTYDIYGCRAGSAEEASMVLRFTLNGANVPFARPMSSTVLDLKSVNYHPIASLRIESTFPYRITFDIPRGASCFLHRD